MLETALAGEGEADLVGYCAAEGALWRDKERSEKDPLQFPNLHRGHQEPQKDAWNVLRRQRGRDRWYDLSVSKRRPSTPNAMHTELKELL